MEGFTFVEKSVYVCGRFTLVGGFTFDGVTHPNVEMKLLEAMPLRRKAYTLLFQFVIHNVHSISVLV